MTEITDYATLLAEAHDTDDLGKVPTDGVAQLMCELLMPTQCEILDIFEGLADEVQFTILLHAALRAKGRHDLADKVSAEVSRDRTEKHQAARLALADHLLHMAEEYTRGAAQDALQEAYDTLHPESDGIAAEDERARVRDWRATA